MKPYKYRRLHNTLRVRFILLTMTLFFLAIIMYGAFVYITMNIFLHDSVKNSLNAVADQVIGSIEFSSGKIQVPENLEETLRKDKQGNLFTQRLLDPQGKTLLAEGQYISLLPPIEINKKQPSYQMIEPDLYIYTEPVKLDDNVLGFVQIAQSTENIENMLKQLLLVLAVSLPFFLLGSAVIGFFIVTRLLKPIDLMTRTARRFSEEELSARINLPQTGDELGRLADTFDEMLTRIEASFKSHRQFTADASHELRTPVSVIQAILSVTKRRPRTNAEYQSAMEDLGIAANRLESLVSALLTMSRSEMQKPGIADQIDLSEILPGILESLRPLAEEKGLTLDADIPTSFTVRGDSDALIHAFINIIDNVIKYTEQGGIRVNGRSEENAIIIEVQDTGTGIEESELPLIFDRFYRVDRSRSIPGSGLGLSIARSIVERHKGQIEAESVSGTGTTIRIILPKT